jgi:hypothetical protein
MPPISKEPTMIGRVILPVMTGVLAASAFAADRPPNVATYGFVALMKGPK